MKKSRLFASVALALLLGATAAHAEGDPAAGKSKAAVCSACHGANGNSNNDQFPNLAGQNRTYIYQQLKHFKSGERQNAIMAGQVANLSDQDMQDLAAYFSTLTMEVGAANEDLADKGEHIYRGGIPAKGVPACSGCHGPAGYGNGPAAYPRISGQKAVYIAKQLKAYRSGERAGYAKAKIMQGVAHSLSDDEIQALSSYVSGLYSDE
jgi:cytochrome c553